MQEMLRATRTGPATWRVRVALPDFLGLLSLVTGLFASAGVSVVRGHVRTIRGQAVDAFEVAAPRPPDWERLGRDLEALARRAREGEIQAVRSELNARIMEVLRARGDAGSERLYPIQLAIDPRASAAETVVDVRSQDTPAFLYELTNALSLLGVNIARMEIETERGAVRDRLWLTEGGRKIVSAEKLRRVQWAILLMKHFTHLLPQVPDPAAALEEIVLFAKEVFARDDFDRILLNLKQSRALKDLSRVLGTSRFLWEEFIRYQHESIHKLLGDRKVLRGRVPKEAMRRGLRRALAAARGFGEKVEALNAFKDREIFRIDLRHLLGKTSYLEEFAEEFSDLAEVVVGEAHGLAWKETLKRLPPPRVSKSRPSEDCVLALGKFGGRELGYASDLEILLVYSDDPTSRRAPENQRFYAQLLQTLADSIHARHKGVFEIDLRLRPYGKAGPAAVSLELFREYYAERGKARGFERQALVKLRPVAGSIRLGRAVEALRDAFVYGPRPFDFAEAAELRARQREELVEPGTVNAKYSAGGLIDVEYLVQTLQIVHGRGRAGPVRHPNTLAALRALRRAGCVAAGVAEDLEKTYVFLRDLINALRIFRGNARDLAIPARGSREFLTLARRMGYAGPDAAVAAAFGRDLERHMGRAAKLYASVLEALERREARAARPVELEGRGAGPVPGLEALLRSAGSAGAARVLAELGFREADAALGRFRRLRENLAQDAAGLRALDGGLGLFGGAADPDLALTSLARLREAAPAGRPFLAGAAHLEAVVRTFGRSRYLADLVVHRPEDFAWMADAREGTLEAARRALAAARGFGSLADLRRFRHRETLRIALADSAGAEPEAVFRAFSDLADRVLGEALRIGVPAADFGVVGLGKLGGRELNYSSDVDLLFIAPPRPPRGLLGRIETFLRLLPEETPCGFLYRVDMRLRPHGQQGNLFMGLADTLRYYRKEADAWELQALIKARPVAGRRGLGTAFVRGAAPLVWRRKLPPAALARLREVKRRYEAETASKGETESNVKMGRGGIRDAEFAVQMLQLLHGWRSAALRAPGTLPALRELERVRLLGPEDAGALRAGYVLFRRIENQLQLFENRQTFLLPRDERGLRLAARALGFRDSGSGDAASLFRAEAERRRADVRRILERVFYGT
jgi:glutamate-ammonia-ligase adenylyltransferase